MGMCPTNMMGVLKVISRSRATLIFSMGVPRCMVPDNFKDPIKQRGICVNER